MQHPDVLESAVIGVPHPVLGEQVTAFVTAREGRELTAGHLKEWCTRYLEPIMQPREIHLLSEMPRSANGKTDKISLKNQWLEKDKNGQLRI